MKITEDMNLEEAINKLAGEAWAEHLNNKNRMKVAEDMDLAALMTCFSEPYSLIELLRLRSILCDSQYFDGPLSDVPAHRMDRFVAKATKHNKAGTGGAYDHNDNH